MSEMFVYRISQTKSGGYDSYDSAVVIAESEAQARLIHPSEFAKTLWTEQGWMGHYNNASRQDIHGEPYVFADPDGESEWAHPDQVTVELIGSAAPESKVGVVLSSFNAG